MIRGTKKLLFCESDFVDRELYILYSHWENWGGFCTLSTELSCSYIFQNSLPSTVHGRLGHKRKIARDLDGRSKVVAKILWRSA